MLVPIDIPSSVDQIAIPPNIQRWIEQTTQRIVAFQDRWDQPQIEQFVAADYGLVYQSLAWAAESTTMIGRRFLEWGSGFAVVSAMAATLDFDVIGIEAERSLFEQGIETLKNLDVQAELMHGNFLPPGAEELAEDSTLPSVGHPVDHAYEKLGLDVDDFALVYSYPWPGEDDFHELVFDRFAATGALMMQFCGPYDVRLWRKAK